jgi:serine protease Do
MKQLCCVTLSGEGHVIDQKGNHGVGSGIVVAENQVATNCHVVANAKESKLAS